MDNTIGIIAVIFGLIVITVFVILRKSNKSRLKIVNQLDNENTLPTELLLEIQSVNSTDLALYRHSEPLTLNNQLKSHIGEVIKLSSNANNIIKNEKKVILNFSEEILGKLKSGELKIMKKKGSNDQFRTIAVDSKNTVRGHGWAEVKDIKKVNPAQLANAVLGVMTVITAQEHLDEINKQLVSIDHKIDTLIRQYRNDKFGKIQGNIRYLKSILPSILNQDEKLKIYETKIEDISLTSYNEIESIQRELPHLINDVSLIKEKAKFGVEKIVNEIKEFTSTFEQTILLGYGNLEVMSVCLKLLNDVDNNSEVSVNRLTDIENYFNQLNEFHNQFENILNDKNLAINATFRRNKTINIKKEELSKHLSYHYETVNNNISTINHHIIRLKNSDKPSIGEPIKLQVEYDEMDNIKAIYSLKQLK